MLRDLSLGFQLLRLQGPLGSLFEFLVQTYRLLAQTIVGYGSSVSSLAMNKIDCQYYQSL